MIPFTQYIRWLPPTNGSYRVQQGEKQCPVCRARIEKVSQAYISWSSIQHLSENIFEALKTCDNQPLDLIIEHHFVGRLKCVHLKDKVILFNISKGWTRAWKIVFIKPFFLSLLRLYFYPELWNLLCTCAKCVRYSGIIMILNVYIGDKWINIMTVGADLTNVFFCVAQAYGPLVIYPILWSLSFIFGSLHQRHKNPKLSG